MRRSGLNSGRPSRCAPDFGNPNRRDAVRTAVPASPEYRGTRPAPNFDAKPLKPNTHDTYFWRIDTTDAVGTVTPGEVWRFRVRQLAFPGAEGYGRFTGTIRGYLNADHSGAAAQT